LNRSAKQCRASSGKPFTGRTRKAKNLEQVGTSRERRVGLLVEQTLKVDRRDDSTVLRARPRAVETRRRLPRRRDGAPEGGEAQEGIGQQRRLNPDGAATDPGEEQSPEGEGGGAWRWPGNRLAASFRSTTRGHGPATSRYGFIGGKPPEERTLDVAAG